METKIFQKVALSTGGGTLNLAATDNVKQVLLSGGGTLTSSHTIQSSGTPKEGMRILIYYNASFVADGNDITIFGYQMLPEEMLQRWVFDCVYYNAQWNVSAIPSYWTNRVKPFEILIANFNITDSDLLSSFSTPLLIVPPPQDSSLAIDVDSAIAKITYNGTPYAEGAAYAGATLALIHDTAEAPIMTNEQALLSTISRSTKFVPYAVTNDSDKQLIPGKGLYLQTLNADPISGDGTMEIEIIYRLVAGL